MLKVLVSAIVAKTLSPLAISRFGSISSQFRMTTSIPNCNLLACQVDSYALEGVSNVIDCIKAGDVYQATLDNSVLYPEGGGQPWDLGTVNGIKVHKVTKGAGIRNVVVEMEDAVEVGASVVCKVDWPRRYDFMQQHTAQVL